MSKSVLVMKTPETCLDCMFCHEFDEGKEAYCYVMDGYKERYKLRPTYNTLERTVKKYQLSLRKMFGVED